MKKNKETIVRHRLEFGRLEFGFNEGYPQWKDLNTVEKIANIVFLLLAIGGGIGLVWLTIALLLG